MPLFTQIDGVERLSHRWTGLCFVHGWVSTQMGGVCRCSHRRTALGVFHADGQRWASFTQIDGIGRRSRVGIDTDERVWSSLVSTRMSGVLLLFTQMVGVGHLTRDGWMVLDVFHGWVSTRVGSMRRFSRVGVDADGRYSSSFTRMDGVVRRSQVGVDDVGAGVVTGGCRRGWVVFVVFHAD